MENSYMIKPTIISLILAIFSEVALLSCTTITVKSVNKEEKAAGMQYSLPKPFILFKPYSTGSGKYTVETIYLPDEARTYAIAAHSLLAKHKLHVKTQNGLLTQVIWNPDSGEIAKKAVETAASLADETLKAKQQAAEEARKAAKEKQDKFQEDINNIDQKIAELPPHSLNQLLIF
jgi:hypothetical protein